MILIYILEITNYSYAENIEVEQVKEDKEKLISGKQIINVPILI
jgi:hypothetical protein